MESKGILGEISRSVNKSVSLPLAVIGSIREDSQPGRPDRLFQLVISKMMRTEWNHPVLKLVRGSEATRAGALSLCLDTNPVGIWVPMTNSGNWNRST